MIQLDITNVTPDVLGQDTGLNPATDFATCQEQVSTVISQLWAERNTDKAWKKWLNLGDNDTLISEIKAYTQSIEGQFDQLVIIGIGGSSLGGIAMFEALLPSYWNERTGEQRGGKPKYYFIDNVDPDKLSALFEILDLKRTLVNVISKSGTTAESMAGYLWLKAALQNSVGAEALSKHLVITTDKNSGILRSMVREEGLTAFEVPDDVGGRFSIFSAVGLLPAGILGINITELLQGIQDIIPALQSTDLAQNPAAKNALIQYLYYQKGKRISVFMPYNAKLASVADWYVQLWAESLGKKANLSGQTVNEGPTPLKAVGVTDQHSQVQLFNEGPIDKVFTFVRVGEFNHKLTIPNLYPDLPDLNYLGGRDFSELLQAEADATRASITSNGRPNVTITLPKLNAYYFAQLLYVLEVQTAIMGGLLNIDPFDQPGVELGKQYTYALMGRPGYEHLVAEASGKQLQPN